MSNLIEDEGLKFIDDGEGALRVQGALTFDTAASGLMPVQAWIKQRSNAAANSSVKNIDLKQVTQIDSAGVALLIEWTRFAKQQGRAIQFIHIPSQLLTMARVSGVDTILPICV